LNKKGNNKDRLAKSKKIRNSLLKQSKLNTNTVKRRRKESKNRIMQPKQSKPNTDTTRRKEI